MALKRYLEQDPNRGTVRLYGTPAEEGGSAKCFMVRDGLFEGVDAAIAWLSIAVGVTCLIGDPFTYGLAVETVNSNVTGRDYTEAEIGRLTNYVLPKMVIGGVTSVSIVSVLIAAYIGPMLF